LLDPHLVHPPVRSGDRTLVDGAMVDPVPAEVARAMGADLVIGVNGSAAEAALPQVQAALDQRLTLTS